MKPAPFEYRRPENLDEALDLLADHGDRAKVLAGGQSLLPLMNLRLARPELLVDVNRLSGLDACEERAGVLRVGALARLRHLERWAATRVPLIAQTLRLVGHTAIRTRGTVVGSLVHADPAAELPALLLCLDGEVTVRSARTERVIAAGDLYRAPLTTSIAADELAVEARFALPPAGSGWGFAEVARRHGDFALVGAMALVTPGPEGPDGRVGRARLGFFGVGGTPVRGPAAETMLVGERPTSARLWEAADAAVAGLTPDGDLHAPAAYRRRVARVLAERTLAEAVARCRGAA